MSQTRSTRASNAKSVIHSYAGRQSCPICGRAFPREILVAHADRCAMRHFAELSGRRKAGKAGRQPENQPQSKDTSCSTPSANADASLVVTFRHKEAASVGCAGLESCAATETTQRPQHRTRCKRMAEALIRTRKRRTSRLDTTRHLVLPKLINQSIMNDDLENSIRGETTVLSTWKRITARSLDDVKESVRRAVHEADDRISRMPESTWVVLRVTTHYVRFNSGALLFTKTNGSLDTKRNEEWQKLLAREGAQLRAFGVARERRLASESSVSPRPFNVATDTRSRLVPPPRAAATAIRNDSFVDEVRHATGEKRRPLVDHTNVLSLLATAAREMAEARHSRASAHQNHYDADAAGMLKLLTSVSYRTAARLAAEAAGHEPDILDSATTPHICVLPVEQSTKVPGLPHASPKSADAAREYISRMQCVHKLSDDTMKRFGRYLRDFQVGKSTQREVVHAVCTLLKDCPDLVRDFLCFLPMPESNALNHSPLDQSATQAIGDGVTAPALPAPPTAQVTASFVSSTKHEPTMLSCSRLTDDISQDQHTSLVQSQQEYGWMVLGTAAKVNAKTAVAINSLAASTTSKMCSVSANTESSAALQSTTTPTDEPTHATSSHPVVPDGSVANRVVMAASG